MQAKTNLEQVKDVARVLLMTEINKTPYSPMIVQHPFTSFGYALTAYNGTATEVTVPSTYKGKDVIAIGSGKIENFQMVGDGFFRNALIKKVVLPNTIITINHGAFARCTELEQVEIPANVRKIGAYAFQDTAISVFTIPKTVVECGEGIFLRCDKLKILSTPLGAHHFGRLFGASTFSAMQP